MANHYEEILEMNGERVVSTLGEEGDYKVFVNFMPLSQEVLGKINNNAGQFIIQGIHPKSFSATFILTAYISDDMSAIAKEFEVEFSNYLRSINVNEQDIAYEIDDIEFSGANLRFFLKDNLSFVAKFNRNDQSSVNDENLSEALKYIFDSYFSADIVGGDRIDVLMPDLSYYDEHLSFDKKGECEEVFLKGVEISGRIPHEVFDDNGCQIYLDHLIDLINDTLGEAALSILKPYFRSAYVERSEESIFEIV